MPIKKTCPCGTDYLCRPCLIDRKKYCCKKCFYKYRVIKRVGYTHSVETREKLSKALKGRILSKEHIEKIRIASTGRKHTKESRQKMSRVQKGRIVSRSTREKLSKLYKGKPRPWLKGENCHFWKGGVTPLRGRIYNSLNYKNWRTKIYESNNYTCHFCRVRGGRLEADHYPKPFSIYLQEIISKQPDKEMWFEDAMNYKPLWEAKGRTLCKECHDGTKLGVAILRRPQRE